MLDKFIQGLQLIREKFLRDGDRGHDVCAEHDAITVWTIDWDKVTAEDIRKMDDLGFFPGMDGDLCDVEDILADEDLPLPEGEYFDFSKITDEQWEVLKKYPENCFTYFC